MTKHDWSFWWRFGALKLAEIVGAAVASVGAWAFGWYVLGMNDTQGPSHTVNIFCAWAVGLIALLVIVFALMNWIMLNIEWAENWRDSKK